MNSGSQVRLIHFFPSHEIKFKDQAKRFFKRPYLVNEWQGFSKVNIDELASNFCEGNHLKFDWVVFHSAPYHAARAIESISEKARVLVQFWGSDYSSILMPQSKLFLSRTRRQFFGLPRLTTLSPQLLNYRWFLFKCRWRRSKYLKAFANCERLSFACGDSEWKWMPRHYQNKRLSWFVNYSAGDANFWQTNMEGAVERNGVLIGNSAAPTNNHLDVLEELRRAPESPKNIIIPLSYGLSGIAKSVQKFAVLNFGSAVEPIVDFMPAQAYFDRLNRCEFVVMGHMRQQALGNLKWAFYTLRTVYLWEGSDVYEYLNAQGFVIRTIDSIEQRGLTPILTEELESNKALAKRNFLNFFEPEVLATFFGNDHSDSSFNDHN